MSIYKVDNFLKQPPPSLICLICKNVLCEPVETPCEEFYCKDCIVQQPRCPKCYQSHSSKDLKPALEKRTVINLLYVKCENFSRGCKKGVNLGAYQRHIEKCNRDFQGQDMPEHKTEAEEKIFNESLSDLKDEIDLRDEDMEDRVKGDLENYRDSSGNPSPAFIRSSSGCPVHSNQSNRVKRNGWPCTLV